MTQFHPSTVEELSQIVAASAANRETLEIVGNRTKRGFGRPVDASHTLTVAKISGVSLYEPEELVLSVRAGTLLSEVETLLEAHQQQLAFEPQHLGAQTIGGVIATGISGPRRIQAGAVRDHLLGFTAVNGRGEIFKSGGRVVKNVTGYDLSKLMAGSFGTLAVLSEVTLKVLPRAEARMTLVARGQSARDGAALLCRALGMPFDITGAAWVPLFGGESVTALRLEGFMDSVADRARTLTGATRRFCSGCRIRHVLGRRAGCEAPRCFAIFVACFGAADFGRQHLGRDAASRWLSGLGRRIGLAAGTR